jgi:hypothetical protein
MDFLMFWTGAIVWCVLGSFVLWIAYCAVVELVVAVDWVRWSIATVRARGKPVPWRSVPGVLLRKWIYFCTQGHGTTTWSGENERWDGFRKWSVRQSGSSQSNRATENPE